MLLNIPPSAAAAERNFSAFSTIHTKKRNRLTTKRASKLVYIYARLLKAMKPDDEDEGSSKSITDSDIDSNDADSDDAMELNSVLGNNDGENSEEIN